MPNDKEPKPQFPELKKVEIDLLGSGGKYEIVAIRGLSGVPLGTALALPGALEQWLMGQTLVSPDDDMKEEAEEETDIKP